jgi:hypothetical protein
MIWLEILITDFQVEFLLPILGEGYEVQGVCVV